MKVTDDDYNLLKKMSNGIDDFFRTTYSIKEARSTDIYSFLKNKEPFKSKLPTGRDFNRFLRRMQKEGLVKKLIPNSDVDPSNPDFFQWRFYRKELKNINLDVNSDSRLSTTKHFKGNKNIPTNNGDFVRSTQEQYIYNRLLNEHDFLLYYERPLKGTKYQRYPDFTIANKLTDTVFHWEHFGMSNNQNYSDKIAERIKWYLEKGYKYIEKGGRLIVTQYKDEQDFHNEVERIIGLIKSS